MKTDFDPNALPLWAWILLALVLLAQAFWIFRDAQKRGVFPWFWGLWGLLHIPLPLIGYYFIVIRRQKKKKKSRSST